MIRKIFKIIPVLFLWIAGIAVCTHLIIPHDHHLIDSLTGQDETCPASNSKTGHHTGFPIHCHAFNELASEKATTFVLIRNIQSDDLLFNSFPDYFVLELNISLISAFDINDPFPDSYFLKLSQLRAPPLVS